MIKILLKIPQPTINPTVKTKIRNKITSLGILGHSFRGPANVTKSKIKTEQPNQTTFMQEPKQRINTATLHLANQQSITMKRNLTIPCIHSSANLCKISVTSYKKEEPRKLH